MKDINQQLDYAQFSQELQESPLLDFFVSGFAIAAIDARIDDIEIETAKEFLRHYEYNPDFEQEFDAIARLIRKIMAPVPENEIFDIAFQLLKKSIYHFSNTIDKMQLSQKQRLAHQFDFFFNLYRVAFSDGVFHVAEKTAISRISVLIGFSEKSLAAIRKKARDSISPFPSDDSEDSEKISMSQSSVNIEDLKKSHEEFLKKRYRGIKKNRIYLSGPFANTDQETRAAWMERVRNVFPDKHFFFSPVERDREYQKHPVAKRSRYIIEDQHRDIFNSDAVIAYLPKPSIGTGMAIEYANSINKIVVIIVPDPEKPPSLTLSASAHTIAAFPEEAIQSVDKYLEGIENFGIEVVQSNGTIDYFDLKKLEKYLENIVVHSGIAEVREIDIPTLSRSVARFIMNELPDFAHETMYFDFFEDYIENYFIRIAATKHLYQLAKYYIKRRARAREEALRQNDIKELHHQSHRFVHDLKSPLGSARRNLRLGYDEIKNLLNDLDPDLKEQFDEYYEFVETDIEDALTEIKKFLQNLSNKINPVSINIETGIRSIYEKRKPSDKDIRLHISNHGTDSLFGIEEKFHRIFNNLFYNSFIHGFPDIDSGNIYVELEPIEAGEGAIIKYWNDGTSLPRERCETIFVPKYRKQAQNSGLGMSSVKESVESMGGTIACHYQETLGPLFVINLHSKKGNAQQKLLIADDNASFRKQIMTYLKKQNFSFVECPSIDETIEKLNSEDFYAILCDIDFRDGQGRDGVDVLNWIQKNDKKIRSIVITGDSSGAIGWRDRAENLKIFKILKKEDEELKSRLQEALK